jgi:hypothetical protein
VTLNQKYPLSNQALEAMSGISAERDGQHTPGSWRTGDMFHTVFGPPNGSPSPEVIATLGKHNVKANARLIAAAPELLEELERIAADNERLGYSPRESVSQGDARHERTRAAIRKAKGTV